MLTPAQYDERERAAIARVPVPMLMAYRPVTFQQVGYPIRVEQEAELLRYVDHNFEAEVPGLFKPGARFAPIAYVNAFTPDERDLLNAVRDQVAQMTLRRFGRSIRPITNLMVQMGPFRIMSEIARAAGKPRLQVFEPGPGMGYLGALLALMGHGYASYDVTQALYLWQNRLLGTIAGDDFVETATEVVRPPIEARVVHLPWWQYADLLWDCPLKVDIVYSNSNLGEMSPLALRQVLSISRAMLADSEIGLFMYMSTGLLAQSTAEGLASQFTQCGYRKVCESPFVGYVVGDRNASALLKGFRKGVPHYSPSGAAPTLKADDVMALRKSEAPLDAQLTAWNYGWQAPFID